MIKSWSDFGTSIFTTMTQAANHHGAVNLAQGFPNFDGPAEVKEAAVEAIRGSWNQYAPSHGIPKLRGLLHERCIKTSGMSYDPDLEITVFSGATEALFCSFLGLLARGDEVITFAPYFDCYPAGAFGAGATLVEIPLTTPDWTFTKEDIEARVTPKTKVILVNTPHNPTGRVFSREEMTIIADIAIRYDLIVVTDEVYEELVYDGTEFVRMNTLPGMRERTVVISSTAKTFSFTGWKVGFTFAPPELTNRLRSVHQFTVFCSATPLQAGLCKALEMQESYYKQLRTDYTARRDFLYSSLAKLGFKMRLASGAYFLVADYGHMSDLQDTAFSLWLTEHRKVAVIPTSVFYNNPTEVAAKQKYVRFAFCKDLETLAQGVRNLGG